MRFPRKMAFFVGFLVILVSSASPQDTEPKNRRDEASFCGDVPVNHTVPIPKKVLLLLLARDEVKENLTDLGKEERPDRLFRAAEVHLGGKGETDLIIIGNRPMGGADNDWFWLVHSAYNNPKIVLWTGANCVCVDQNGTKGLRNVTGEWSSASETVETLYRFNGIEYKRSTQKRSMNRP